MKEVAAMHLEERQMVLVNALEDGGRTRGNALELLVRHPLYVHPGHLLQCCLPAVKVLLQLGMRLKERVKEHERRGDVARHSAVQTLLLLEEHLVPFHLLRIHSEHPRQLLELFLLLRIGTAIVMFAEGAFCQVVVLQILSVHDVLRFRVFIPEYHVSVLVLILLDENSALLVHSFLVHGGRGHGVHLVPYFVFKHI